MLGLSRRDFALGLTAGAGLALSACNRGATTQRIAVSFHNMAEPFFVVMRRELMDEAAKLGVEVSVLDGQANSSKQASDIETALTQGVAGVILAPTDVRALTPAVNRVLADNVPIVTVDRRIEGASRPVAHIGADNVAGGRMMVEWIVRARPQGARVVLLTGQPGSSTAIDRTRGAKEALAAAGPAFVLAAEQTGNWSREQGLTVTQNILTAQASTPPDVILAENDDMAFGAIEALRTSGISGLAVLGFDATPEALRRVRDGSMALTVEQSPSRQIRSALRQIVGAVRDNRPPQSLAIEPVVITRDTLEQAERISEA